MSIVVDEQTTLADIDEALSHIVSTLRESEQPQRLAGIVDGLLDERLAMSHVDSCLHRRR